MTVRLLTVADVADLVQCSRKTVMRAIHAGDLRAAQLASRGTWRVRLEDVDAWIELRSLPPAPPEVDPVLPVPPGVVRPLRARRGRPTGMLQVTREMGRTA